MKEILLNNIKEIKVEKGIVYVIYNDEQVKDELND